jgi:hypothetical protein
MKAARANTIYIAGPMTGLPEWNYPAFHRASAEWRRNGWTVLNPAEGFGGRTDLPYERYMRAAIKLVMRSSAIALLPGWQASRGACMEVLIAARQGYEFFDAVTGRKIATPDVHVIVMHL